MYTVHTAENAAASPPLWVVFSANQMAVQCVPGTSKPRVGCGHATRGLAVANPTSKNEQDVPRDLLCAGAERG